MRILGPKGQTRARSALMVALLIALAMPTVWPASAAAQTPEDADAPLDLAAMILTPDDLATEAIEGFFVAGGEFTTLDEQVAFSAEDRDPDELREALSDAGFLRRYDARLELLRDPDDPDARVGVRIVTAVTEYETSEGASAGFAAIEDETDPAERDVEGTASFDDESEITSYEREVTDAEEEDIAGLNLTFRLDNLVADVVVESFTAPDYAGPEPEVEQVEALGELLQARIEQVLADGGPGLSNLVAHIDEADAPVAFEYDVYERIDGEDLPVIGIPDEDELAQRYGDATSAFHHEQALQAPGDPYYTVNVFAFDDEDGAAAWFEDLDSRFADTLTYVDVEPVDGADDLGDESAALSYGFELDEEITVEGYIVAVRVENVVATVQVDALPSPDLDTVIELAEAQTDCLTDGACLDPIPAPEALITDATPEADDAEEEDDEGGLSDAFLGTPASDEDDD